MRTFFIWLFGLLASGIVAGIAGETIAPYNAGGFLGFIAGLCAFSCARLWLVPSKS